MTGLLLAVVITAASVQDRDAARPLLWNLHRACRRVRLAWADAVYTGKLTAWAAALRMRLQIVARRNPHAFEVLPRRWVVERTFAWISKHRRTVRDYERLPASGRASHFPDCGSFRILDRKGRDNGRKIQEILTGVPGRGSPDGGRDLARYCRCGTGTRDQ